MSSRRVPLPPELTRNGRYVISFKIKAKAEIFVKSLRKVLNPSGTTVEDQLSRRAVQRSGVDAPGSGEAKVGSEGVSV